LLDRGIVVVVKKAASSRYARWVFACTAGELVGFGGIPILGSALALCLTSGVETPTRSLVLYAVAIIGGLGEGAVLAWFQLRALTKFVPGLNARHWILATATAASFAWACGMLAPTLDDIVGISDTTQIAIWVPASVLILMSTGTAQAWVLRRVVDNPKSWIVGNSLGWLAGLPWTFVLPSLLSEDAPTGLWIATFVVAGILMGLSVGLVTGVALLRLRPIHISDTRDKTESN